MFKVKHRTMNGKMSKWLENQTNKADNTNCWHGCGTTGALIPFIADGNEKWYKPLWKIVWKFLT